MGEYAIRSDGQKIKIGTCPNMYYLRIEDAHTLTPIRQSVDPAQTPDLLFRLPYPDEDDLQPGTYAEYNRTLQLYRDVEGQHFTEDYCPDYLAEGDNIGYMQLFHASGLMANVRCYHRTKLPELGDEASVHWVKQTPTLALYAVMRTADGSVIPITRCNHCGSCWRDTWENILPFVPDQEMRARLAKHQGGTQP